MTFRQFVYWTLMFAALFCAFSRSAAATAPFVLLAVAVRLGPPK